MPAPVDDRTLEAYRREHGADHVRERVEVLAEVREMNAAAIRHVESIVAPLMPVAQDVAMLKAETARQTPLLTGLVTDAKHSRIERRKRHILDEAKREDTLKWKKRYRTGAAILAALATALEFYRALRGHV